jgi:integrase
VECGATEFGCRFRALDKNRINPRSDHAIIDMKKPRGPHPNKRLTAVTVRAARNSGRYADGNGLYLVVDDSGAKRWLLRTNVSGKRRDIGLGSVRLVDLAKARVEAARLRQIARAGGDPLSERRRERRGMLTFEEAAKLVHASHSATFRNTKHKAQWLSSLEQYVFPKFGKRPLDKIEPAEVLNALSAVWTTKPETARRVRQRIKVVFEWARASGYRESGNPVDGVAKVLPKVRQAAEHHPALPYVQVPAFIRAMRDAEASEPTKLAFEFLILTAGRTSEVIGAKWDEMDLDAKTWVIPASRIKAARQHRVPLSTRCVELLDKAKALKDGGPFVFPGRSSEKPLSNMAFLMLLRRLHRTDITAHGFRSAFRDWAAERTTFPRAVCEAALAHVVKDKTEAAYFRSVLFEQRRKLMDSWTKFATARPANIVSIRA